MGTVLFLFFFNSQSNIAGCFEVKHFCPRSISNGCFNTDNCLTSNVHALTVNLLCMDKELAKRDGGWLNCCRVQPGECHSWTSSLQVCLTPINGNTDSQQEETWSRHCLTSGHLKLLPCRDVDIKTTETVLP